MVPARGQREITVPETKPATEWVLGEAVRKVSPRRRHAVLQLAIGSLLRTWARGRGIVGSEWRFRIAPPGEPIRPLVPDIAFLSNERRAGLTGEHLEVPLVAPDLVVEILSPDDRADRIASKRDAYLSAGTQLVLIVDPDARTIEAFDAGGNERFVGSSTFSDARFPDLSIDLASLFAELDDTS